MDSDSEKGQWSLSERDMQEWKFLSQGIWQDLPRSLVRVNYLPTRLSSLLLGQIASELPSLIEEINSKIHSCQSPQPISESGKRQFSKYGKLPRGGILGQNSKGRTYFDSGDFALVAADPVTEDGAIQPGSAHPHRDGISHPYAPPPAASNVDKHANEDLFRKSESPEKSPLLQHSNIEDERPTNEEKQHSHISH